MGIGPIGGVFFSAPKRERPKRNTENKKKGRNLRTPNTSTKGGRNGPLLPLHPRIFSKRF
jgi:hypothetical protein